MATQLFFNARNAIPVESIWGSGNNDAKLDGTGSGWLWSTVTPPRLGTSRGTSALRLNVSSVDGPTNGIEFVGSEGPVRFISPPLAADITISGTITFNLWAFESNMSANAAINCQISKIDGATGAITQIIKTTRTTELGTSSSAANFAETPISTSFKRGDRIMAIPFADDSGTMNTGFIISLDIDSASADTLGDSYITFTENFSFESIPTGTTIYLSEELSDVSTTNFDRKASFARDSSITATDIVTTVNGWTAPRQLEEGGTPVDWFTPPLEAVTLGGAVLIDFNAYENNLSANASIRVEIAVVDNDGTNPIVWAVNSYPGELSNSSSSHISMVLSGDDITISAQQRLRIRVYADDTASVPMVSGFDVRLGFGSTTAGGSFDSLLTFGQTLTEFTSSVTVTTYAQAQAKIKRTYNVFSQAQARIKTTYNGYSQAQARTKQTYNTFAQAQAWIEQTYNGYGQSQARIKQIYQSFAQAQTRILRTYTVHAQAQAKIGGAVTVYAQAQAFIAILIATDNFQRTVSSGWGISTPDPTIEWVDRDTIVPGIIEEGSVDGSTAHAPAGIIQTRKKGYPYLRQGIIQFDFWVPANITSGGDYNIDSQTGGWAVQRSGSDWTLIDPINGDFNFHFTPDASSWYTVKFFLDVAGETVRAKVWKRGTQEPNWLTEVTKTSNNAPDYFLVESPSAEDAQVDNIFFLSTDGIFSQLKTYRQAAQAQASIRVIEQNFAQAQSKIISTPSSFAQGQALIYIPKSLRPIEDITTSTNIVGVVV